MCLLQCFVHAMCDWCHASHCMLLLQHGHERFIEDGSDSEDPDNVVHHDEEGGKKGGATPNKANDEEEVSLTRDFNIIVHDLCMLFVLLV